MKSVVFEQIVPLVCFSRYIWELRLPWHRLNLDEYSKSFYFRLICESYIPFGWLPIVSWTVEKCKCGWCNLSISKNNPLNSFQNLPENLVRSALKQLPAPAGTFSWSPARCYTGSSFTYIWYVYFCTCIQFW